MELAEFLGVTQGWISRLTRVGPKLEDLDKLALLMGTTPEALVAPDEAGAGHKHSFEHIVQAAVDRAIAARAAPAEPASEAVSNRILPLRRGVRR